MTTDTKQTIMLGVFLVLLAFIAAMFDDSAEVRNLHSLPEPPNHLGKVNYGKP